MALLRSEEEVDEIIAKLISRTKGKYITQGVSFDKTSKRHMELLRNSLLHSSSFAPFVRELIADHFSESPSRKNTQSRGEAQLQSNTVPTVPIPPIRNTGNFT